MVDADSLHPDVTSLLGTTIAERYRVDELLGLGGMGAVFRGRHLGLERDVAIKVLHAELTRDPELSARFEREAHSASRLDHPNCLAVTDVGTTWNGLKFMVMQLLEGVELAEMMGEPFPPDRAVVMAMQILNGLEHAHDKGVVHRDIKPENIFVTTDHAGRETLKIVDFGIAKLVGSAKDGKRNMTKAGLVFGTPAYMSPEQAMGQDADGRADLYSVGIMLWEMLAGEQPFTSDDPVALVRMQVSKDAPPLPPSVPPILDPVVMKLLEKRRDDRYQSATEARQALETLLPSIATTDVSHMFNHSGPLPMVNTGPISVSGPIALTGSGPISVSMPIDDTAQQDRVALATMPPRAKEKHRRRWPWLGAGLAAVVVAGAIMMMPSDEAESAEAEEDDGVAEVSEPKGPDGEADEDLLFVDDDGPTDAQLAEIDRLILAKKNEDADKLLGPLLDQFPDSARLIWRHGRLLVNEGRKKRSQALAAYASALEKDPALLEDKDFYAELSSVMRKPGLRDEALDVALRQMGSSAHKYLLEVVNDDKKPLEYDDRHRALEQLATDPENAALINKRLNRALDVLQAHASLTPCANYHGALDAIAAEPEYYFYQRVERAELPTPKEGKHLTEAEVADASRCVNSLDRREEVLALLATLEPEPEDTGGEEGEEVPANTTASASSSGKSGSKSSGKSSGKSGSKTAKRSAKSNPNCAKFGAAVFNKQCR